jgi:hypothetical protein
MKAATKRSRLASPAGFALVLLLFLVMPFSSASCDVPEAGSVSADYTGARLAAGADARVGLPKGLEDIADELLLVAGVVLPFVPRLRHELRYRMFGGAAIAVLAGALMIATQVVAQANLTDELTAYARKLAQNEPVPNIDRIGELMHAEVGYWLSLIGLILIAGLSVGNVFKDKIASRRPEFAHATAAGSAPIWHAESPEPAEPPAPAPTEPPAPVGPGAPTEPPAPTGPEGPSEPPAPTERPGGEPTP